MLHGPASLRSIAVVVVRKADRFLMVHERGEQGWYFPAGGVHAGETFVDAAVRETREEAGLRVVIDGIYRLEHRPRPEGTRLRVFFAGSTLDDIAAPKSFADEHSLGAAWLTLAELTERKLRGDEVLDVLNAVHAGASPHPLSLLVEGPLPWR